MTKIILIRHGETNKNINNSLHATNDTETLNSNGIEQIKLASNRLKILSPSKIYSSKEKRAIESAKILSESLNIPYESIDGMEERNWGIYTGKPWADVKVVLDKLTLEERYNYIPENGESWKTFETRLVNTIKTIVENNSDKTVIVVTHGGAIRALIPYLLNIPKEESFKYDPDNASIFLFNYNGKTYTQEDIVNL